MKKSKNTVQSDVFNFTEKAKELTGKIKNFKAPKGANELNTRLAEIYQQKNNMKALNSILDQLKKHLEEQKATCISIMEKKKMPEVTVPNVGKFAVKKTLKAFYPAEPENRIILFNFLKKKLGPAGFLKAVSIPYMKINSMIKDMQEDLEVFYKEQAKNQKPGFDMTPIGEEGRIKARKLKNEAMAIKTADLERFSALMSEANELEKLNPYLLPGVISTKKEMDISVKKA